MKLFLTVCVSLVVGYVFCWSTFAPPSSSTVYFHEDKEVMFCLHKVDPSLFVPPGRYRKGLGPGEEDINLLIDDAWVLFVKTDEMAETLKHFFLTYNPKASGERQAFLCAYPEKHGDKTICDREDEWKECDSANSWERCDSEAEWRDQ